MVIRIATMNNFNCTAAEYKHAALYGNRAFVNSNIKCINARTAGNVNSHDHKIVLTINPDVIMRPAYLEKLQLISREKVAFIRLKYCPGHGHVKLYGQLVSMGYNVVITMMRFRSRKMLDKYVEEQYRDRYTFKKGYFRIDPDTLPKMFKYICDRSGKGCGDCYNCSILTVGHKDLIYGINLSTSGPCPYNCPDCYAKNIISYRGAKYDQLKQNSKMESTKEILKGMK